MWWIAASRLSTTTSDDRVGIFGAPVLSVAVGTRRIASSAAASRDGAARP